MPIMDIFSKRRKRELGEVPDVYVYDKISNELKTQIVHIWTDAFGHPGRTLDETGNLTGTYFAIVNALRREYGTFSLWKGNPDPNNPRQAFSELVTFFFETKDLNRVLDVIELTAQYIDAVTREFGYLHRRNSDEIATAAIDELNQRFKEHGFGYVYSDGILMRVDSEFAHSEVVRPALVVLRQKGYESAQSEFLAAHERYREGKGADALVECYKAFESTMKIICAKRGWKTDASKGAADLVKVCLDNGLIPAYWQTYFAGLRSVLQSAIPTPRNKQAGHGAGATPIVTPSDELVAYVLHMTAATILFLTEAERKLP